MGRKEAVESRDALNNLIAVCRGCCVCHDFNGFSERFLKA